MSINISSSLIRRIGEGIGLAGPRRASKPLRTYGTPKRRKLHEDLEVSLASFDQADIVDPDVESSPASENAAFSDSAYQSMTATLNEVSDGEVDSAMRDELDHSTDIEPRILRLRTIRGSQIGLAGKKPYSGGKRRHSSISQQEENETAEFGGSVQNSQSELTETTPEISQSKSENSLRLGKIPNNVANVEDSFSVRTSGRQRKLSRKMEESFAKDGSRSLSRSGKGIENRGGQADVLTTTPTRKSVRSQKSLHENELLKQDSPAPLEKTPKKSIARAASWSKKKAPVVKIILDVPATVQSTSPEPASPEPEAEDPLTVRLNTYPADLSVPGNATTIEKPLQASSESHQSLSALLQNPRYHPSFHTLKSEIMAGLTGKRRLPLIGLDDEYQKVLRVVEQTIAAGEGNSMLLIGARGSAKTTLVETVLSQLAGQHEDDFHVVRLNGFIHTDDKLALKEIWRQLGREMSIDEDDTKAPNNYADTLLSLLALLSHTTDESPADENTRMTSKSVIFVIDEFDLFAGHGRQTLLYNLFDIAQSRKAPIAVLGLTTRLDVMESLEKRVKSRFSHRYVYLPWPKTLASFRRICGSALSCTDSESSFLDANIHDGDNNSNNGSDDADDADDADDNKSNTEANNAQNLAILKSAWSGYIDDLLTTSPTLSSHLRSIYARSKSIPTFLSTCLIPIATMTPTALPTPAAFLAHALVAPDSKLDLLAALSELELSLLVGAARLDIVLDTDTCNFNMAYDEYFRLASRARMLHCAVSGGAAAPVGTGTGLGSSSCSSGGGGGGGGGSRVWSREVALGAWERLERLELLVPVTSAGGAGGLTQLGRAGRLWKVDVTLEEIGACGVEMSAVLARWCRII